MGRKQENLDSRNTDGNGPTGVGSSRVAFIGGSRDKEVGTGKREVIGSGREKVGKL